MSALPAVFLDNAGPSGLPTRPSICMVRKTARAYENWRDVRQNPAGENAVTLAARPLAAASRASQPPNEFPARCG